MTIQPEIMLILARARNGVIGHQNKMPWHIPADLRHFKRLTINHPMIMGRQTFESLPGLLPDRPHIVLTHNMNWQAEGCEVAHNLDQAIEIALRYSSRIAIIGGAQIFKQSWSLADYIELTEIEKDYTGDTYVDLPDMSGFSLESQQDYDAESGQPAFCFKRFMKRKIMP
ncbi:dihydrofolate reductase [Zymomonas mobilis]|uniref:Dihydrofolate reductase n=1 Tax=Zymomonas mobilis subsp. pomaceae (strain ATCC 29192 / DSM 22645 / JCM 10191 / CCUG 17912 / NBRC 13757 / NCIMB 11200 / NRRL B-4491 / Barker I) TaxID=579138 RepID=F8ESJ4_ZYMMT|nr:dihydrofolate reductase region [Zymomonas mobilis subsp. pomaceae ATCC 29192]